MNIDNNLKHKLYQALEILQGPKVVLMMMLLFLLTISNNWLQILQ